MLRSLYIANIYALLGLVQHFWHTIDNYSTDLLASMDGRPVQPV